jgi:hypothetical protein
MKDLARYSPRLVEALAVPDEVRGMRKLLLYIFPVILVAGGSVWLGQKWRYEGAVEESQRTKEGGILFENFRAEAEAEAERIVAEKERDGKVEGSAILAKAKAESRIIALDGLAIQALIESSGELATKTYYLDPMYGSESAITALRIGHDNLAGEERENAMAALEVLVEAMEETQDAIASLRAGTTKRAAETFARARPSGGCTPFVISASATNGGGR